MSFVLFLACAAVGLISARHSLAGEGIAITLKEQVSVHTPSVRLGDVADIQARDPGRLRQLASLPVAVAPPLGSVLTLNRERLLEQIMGAAGGPGDLRFLGAEAVQVKLQGRAVTADELFPLLKTHLTATTSWRESEVEIRSIGNLSGIELPPGDVALHIRPKTVLSGARSSLIPIEATLDGRPYRTFWINADFRIRAEVPQAAKHIPYGKSVTGEDVRMEIVEIPDARLAYFRKLEDVIGLVTRRTLSPGDPLTPDSLANPFLIRSGDIIHLSLQRYGIQATVLARAEQNGRLGQLIRIRNLEFSRPLRARVTGRAEVRIE